MGSGLDKGQRYLGVSLLSGDKKRGLAQRSPGKLVEVAPCFDFQEGLYYFQTVFRFVGGGGGGEGSRENILQVLNNQKPRRSFKGTSHVPYPRK